MRIFRFILLGSLAILCATFIFRFVSIERDLWQMCEPRDISLLGLPHVCVYRAWTHQHREHDGWTLLLLADSPEGTKPIVYFPTWPLVIAAGGFLIYALHELFNQGDRRVA